MCSSVAQKRLLEYLRLNRDLVKANVEEAVKAKDHLHQRKRLTLRCQQQQELIRMQKEAAMHLTEQHDTLALQYERLTLVTSQERDNIEARLRTAESNVRDLHFQLEQARDEVQEERRLRGEVVHRQAEVERERVPRDEVKERVTGVNEQLTRVTREMAELRHQVEVMRVEKEATERALHRQTAQHTLELEECEERVRTEQRQLTSATSELQQLTLQLGHTKVRGHHPSPHRPMCYHILLTSPSSCTCRCS